MSALYEELYEGARNSGIPPYMWGALCRYIAYHHPTGAFLRKVLANDLMGATEQADTVNRYCLGLYVAFLRRYAPPACYGSTANVKAWLDTIHNTGESNDAQAIDPEESTGAGVQAEGGHPTT